MSVLQMWLSFTFGAFRKRATEMMAFFTLISTGSRMLLIIHYFKVARQVYDKQREGPYNGSKDWQ